jgi:hypothetical protein
MSHRIHHIKQRLADSRRFLNEVLDRVGGRDDIQVYSEGAGWNVRQLAVHLAVTERGQVNTIMGVARGEEIVPPDFDLERYNRRSVEKRADMTIEQAREQLQEARAELLNWLDTVSDADLDKQGRHGSLKIMSVAELLTTIATHEETHAHDLARVLGIEEE